MGLIWLRARSLDRWSLFGRIGRGERGLIIGSVFGVETILGRSESDISGVDSSIVSEILPGGCWIGDLNVVRVMIAWL